MKLALAGAVLWSIALCAMAQMPAGTPVLLAPTAGPLPPWAYLILPAGIKPPPDDGKPQRLPGSSVEYTWTQIRDLFSAKDWYAGTLPAMPDVVARGRKPDVFACGMCHYPNGQGKPENSSIAGLPAAYIAQQMSDYQTGLRRSSEPRMRPPSLMLQTAKAANEAEVKAAADYFSRLKYQQWIRVVETPTVPRTEIILGPMLGAVHNGGSEPIGQRVIEIAEALERVELRDSRAGFVAYVPPGSIAKGEALANNGAGGRTIPCNICHGKDLKGLGDVPALVGRSPTYVVRQLYDIQSGARNGAGAQLMKAVVEKLTLEDMIALAAYTASRAP